MPTILSCLALIIALAAFVRKGAGTATGDSDAREARRRLSQEMEHLGAQVAAHKRWLGLLARGDSISPEMIEEGLLFQDVDPKAARGLAHADGARWLDVRTQSEVAAGVIPGAQWVPMDEIEARLAELPKSEKWIVYCAGGVRSANVCQFLATQGYGTLYNLEAGIGSWDGDLENHSA